VINRVLTTRLVQWLLYSLCHGSSGLIRQSDLRISASFRNSFPIFNRTTTHKILKTRFLQYKNRSLLRNRNLPSQNSDWLPSVVRRWGGHGGGTRGADSEVFGGVRAGRGPSLYQLGCRPCKSWTPFLKRRGCLFLYYLPARASAHARHVLAFAVSRFSAGNDLDNN